MRDDGVGMHSKSKEWFERAVGLMPGGVNSPVRAFRAVGGEPVFIASGKGSRMTDVDGNTYIDYAGSWGPLILGHRHPEVMEALAKVLETGTSFGACTTREVELAEQIQKAFPSIERVRLVNSGTEATLSALRVARAATGRDKILKFEGCYHGHADSLLVKAGSGVATLGLPDSPGVPAALAALTLTAPFHDALALENIFDAHRNQIAAAIVEPVAGNMGCVPPQPGFLEKLRALTEQQGTVLILDEVMTGFRVAYGGAQQLYKIKPDMTCLGKVIGGGLPVGAFGGRRGIMEKGAPIGPIYQAGTLSGNPLAMTAGIETLKLLSKPGVYKTLEKSSSDLQRGLSDAAKETGVPTTFNRVGSMFTGFFTDRKVKDFASAKTSDTDRFGRYFLSMLKNGINLAPSQFEAAFLSLAHTKADINRTIEAARKSLKSL